jgi:hypothetical protein
MASFWTGFGTGASLASLVEAAVVWAFPVAWAVVAVGVGTGAVEAAVPTSSAAGCNINDGFGKFPLGACGTTASSVSEPESADGSFLAVDFESAAPCCPAPLPFSRSSNSARPSKTFLNAVVFEAGESCESWDGARETTGEWSVVDAGAETITVALMQVRDHNVRRRLSAR